MNTPSLRLAHVQVKDLRPNPGNIRQRLDGIDELAASLRSVGLLQPLLVNDVCGDLVVTDGHRRLAAAKRAGLQRLLCIVTRDAPDDQVVGQMLAASMHTELRPVEQGRGFQQLRRHGMTVAEISHATGFSQATIRARIALLDLPPEAQDMVDAGQIRVSEANQLATQVKRTNRGTAQLASDSKARWFDSKHRLSGAAGALCLNHPEHRARRRFVAGVACGQCWEAAIRADERDRQAVTE